MEIDKKFSLPYKIAWCDHLLKILNNKSLKQKKEVLEELGPIASFLKLHPIINEKIQSLPPNITVLLLELVALEQEHILTEEGEDTALKELGKTLLVIDNFYQEMGGVIGYQKAVLELLKEAETPSILKNISYTTPPFFDICKRDPVTKEKVFFGLKNLSKMAFILPMGGAGDRLGLIDEKTKKPMPAAKLPFLGLNLLEIMIRDIQALEYLYYKTYGIQHISPVIIMTSSEKDNSREILKIFKSKKWYGRGKESFFFLQQISVPMLKRDGNWAIDGPFKPLLKPGGHGALWKLMLDNQAFEWLKKKGAIAAIIRQVNNPVAFTDHGILAFIGFGLSMQKSMGFASCPRAVNSAEGMNILKATKIDKKKNYAITNIEYTDFKRFGIIDTPIYAKSPYSKYPSNTNILFIDLKKIKNEVKKNPFPGKTINMKNKVGNDSEKTEAGRLELMMQNIADGLTSSQCSEKNLQSFLTYNERSKTLSCTKKSFSPEKTLLETPEGCFLDVLRNNHELLTKFCKMKLPACQREEDFLKKGPAFIILIHPALGPLYDIIAQKISRGELKKQAEMQLEIAELHMENVYLDGSLLIKADNIIGTSPPLIFNNQIGRCFLNNVKILNSGIDWQAPNIFWQNKIKRHGLLNIHLYGNSEFIAENLTFKNNQVIKVPNGKRVIAYEKDGGIKFKSELL